MGVSFPDRGRENAAAVAELAASGKIKPRVHATFPLDQWRDAFELLAQRRVIGKAVILP